MRTTRLWIARALAAAAAGVVLMIVGVPGWHSPSGPVRGHVNYNGQPLTSGLVLFYPMSSSGSQIGVGRIDKAGDYSVNPSWTRPGPEMGLYKVCILPGDRPRILPHASPRRPSRPSNVVLASLASESSEDQAGDDALLSMYSTYGRSNLEVKLGPEPACIDIDIND